MSPEQAKGKPADKRSDVWAFGAVLFEMLTGKRAFGGDDISDTLANLLKVEPKWEALPAGLSPTLVVYLKRCLYKDAKQRLGDMHDMRLALEGAFETAAPQPTSSPLARLALAGLVLVTAVSLGLTMIRPWRSPAPTEAAELRLDVVAPGVLNPFSLAVSPDGRQLAFATSTADGSGLWVRPLDQPAAKPLPGTDGATAPFWAPDSRTLGFFANGKLMRVDIDGGAPRVLAATTGAGYGWGSWSLDDIILLTSGNQVFRIPGAGGETGVQHA